MMINSVTEREVSMNYQDLITGMKRFGSTEHDICVHGIGITPEQVQENVIIAPWWEPSILPGLGTADFLSASEYYHTKAWHITSGSLNMTYIKTGIGAPVLMDTLLALGVTACKKIIFIGSVGALDETIGIGDIVIPYDTICGDGASRYIASDLLSKGDVFGEKVYPDTHLFNKAKEITEYLCKANRVKWHIGKTFSIDTIFAQYAHIDEILGMGCNVIEMETAAAFRAAALANIPMAAHEMNYRKYVRRELFPKIILDIFNDVDYI